jgi:hypothetical protein
MVTSLSECMLPSTEEDRLRRESKLEQEVEEEQANPPQRPSLEKLVAKDRDLYQALEFFLLASPKRQLMQEGEPASIKEVADEARLSGNNLSARINYESAAKMALYEQDREALKELLELADGVTNVERFRGYHRAILQNLDEAIRIAKEYYSGIEEPGPSAVESK